MLPMIEGPVAIAIRLSSRQVSLIWPGLNFVVLAERTRKARGVAHCSYPYGMQPLPRGFDCGTYSERMMSSINGLWDSLGPKRKTGGRLRLDTFGIRAALLAVRLTLQVPRFLYRTEIDGTQRDLNLVPRRDEARRGRLSAELKSLRQRKQSELPKLKTQTNRVIKTLERLGKRAIRRFSAMRSKQEVDTLSGEWGDHVRWIRFNLAYFQPFKLPPDFRIMQRRRIDTLVKMAKQEIQRRRSVAPDEKELRKIARAFVRSCKQGHHGQFDYLYMGYNAEDPAAQRKLFEFFEPRIGGGHEPAGSPRRKQKQA